jgi:uncharacterized SAM-binding protein YcdF (DUF218 family)
MAVAALAGISFFMAGPVLQAAGTFLAAEDPLAPADAVIAISGNNSERVHTAALLLRDGYAQWLILSGSPRSIVEMERLAHDFGVPKEQIFSDPNATSTLENAHGSAEVMKSHRLRSAILVTSPYHMRRAITLFRDVFGRQGLEIRAYPAQNSIFRADGWWRRSNDREFVIREYVKLLGVVVGVR